MKKQVLLSLAALALVTLACSLMSGLGGDTGAPEVPGDSDSAPPESSVTEAPAVSEDAGAGLETIDLSDPALHTTKDDYPAFKMTMNFKYEGVDTAGNPKTFDQDFTFEAQKEPKAQHISMAGDTPDESMEFVTIGDQSMSVFPGVGCTVFPTDSMEGPGAEEFLAIPDFSKSFKGQAQRAETGVDIEGTLTDRYTITAENMNDSEDEFTNITNGNVYVSQDGGYIVRVELTGTVKTATLDFDPNTDVQLDLNYTLIPVTDGSINIVPPSECAEQLSGDSKYPVMDGAEGLIVMGDTVFYTVNASLGDVAEFYKTEMPADGWTLANEMGAENISFFTLEFTKDSEAVDVDAITTGEGVAVTITKK